MAVPYYTQYYVFMCDIYYAFFVRIFHIQTPQALQKSHWEGDTSEVESPRNSTDAQPVGKICKERGIFPMFNLYLCTKKKQETNKKGVIP